MKRTMAAYLPITEILAGLAEECAELGQAALKLRRVFDGTNPTPKSEEKAIEDIYQEVADVLIYIDSLSLCVTDVDRIIAEKMARADQRFKELEKEAGDAA